MISNYVSRFTSVLTLTALFGAGSLTAQAQTVFYDNTANFSGFAFSNGGAAAQGTAPAINTITTLVADDISLSDSRAVNITSFEFTVSNLSTTAIKARPRVRFYLGDGANGGPGTLLTGFSFGGATGVGSTFPARSVITLPEFTGNTSTLFTVPANSYFWAGVTFDNNTGATGATAAQLNNLGQGLFDPPTIGNSVDAAFQTTAAGSFLGNNPAGGLFNFGGSPIASFGWQFTGIAQTPEPGAVATLLGFGVSGLALLRRRRSARK